MDRATWRNRVDSCVRRTVWAPADCQKCADVLLVDRVDAGCLDEGPESSRPEDLPRFPVVVKKWTHAGEVARKNDRSSACISDDDAPVADHLAQTRNSPPLIGRADHRLVRGVGPKRQPREQIVAVVDPAF